MKRLAALCTLAITLFPSACYHYVPEVRGRLTQGRPVRLHLRAPQSFALPNLTAHNIESLTAEMVREEADTVVVSALWLNPRTGEGFPGQNWTFQVSRTDITSLEVRTFSSWRTATVLAGCLLATWLGFDTLGGGDEGGGGPNGGGVAR